MTTNADRLNTAIVKKVEKVLANTDRIDSIRIVIEGSREEATTIQYNIKEFVDFDGVNENADTGNYAMKKGEQE